MLLRKINAETGIFIEDTFEIELLEDGTNDPQYSYIETPIPSGVYAERGVSPKWTGTEWLATAEPPEPPEPTPQPLSKIEKLEAKITAANEYTDFLEEVIVEMAQAVYE